MKYLLVIFMSNMQPTQLGPFDGLLACEKASSMAYVVAREVHPKRAVGTLCVGVKEANFTFKEPLKK